MKTLTDYLTEKNIEFTVSPAGHITVNGDLCFFYESIVPVLPDNLTIRGFLFFGVARPLRLPDDLTVGGNLYLSGSGITTLPDNLTVNGTVFLLSESLSDMVLPAHLRVPGKTAGYYRSCPEAKK